MFNRFKSFIEELRTPRDSRSRENVLAHLQRRENNDSSSSLGDSLPSSIRAEQSDSGLGKTSHTEKSMDLTLTSQTKRGPATVVREDKVVERTVSFAMVPSAKDMDDTYVKSRVHTSTPGAHLSDNRKNWDECSITSSDVERRDKRPHPDMRYYTSAANDRAASASYAGQYHTGDRPQVYHANADDRDCHERVDHSASYRDDGYDGHTEHRQPVLVRREYRSVHRDSRSGGASVNSIAPTTPRPRRTRTLDDSHYHTAEVHSHKKSKNKAAKIKKRYISSSSDEVSSTESEGVIEKTRARSQRKRVDKKSNKSCRRSSSDSESDNTKGRSQRKNVDKKGKKYHSSSDSESEKTRGRSQRKSSHKKGRRSSSSSSSSCSDSSWERNKKEKKKRNRRKHKRNELGDKDSTPPKFNGKCDFLDYINQFECYCAANCWSYKTKGYKLSFSLVDEARSVFSTLKSSKRTDYESLYKALLSRFAPSGHESKYQNELLARKRGKNESLNLYGYELQRLASRAYSKQEFPESLLVQLFLNGLKNKPATRHVSLQHPDSLEEAIALATEYMAFGSESDSEGESKCNNKNEGKHRKPRQENSGFVHAVGQIPMYNNTSMSPQYDQLLESMGNLNNRLANIENKQSNPNSQPSDKPTPNTHPCYHCGLFGHWASTCPNKREKASHAPSNGPSPAFNTYNPTNTSHQRSHQPRAVQNMQPNPPPNLQPAVAPSWRSQDVRQIQSLNSPVLRPQSKPQH